MDQRTAYGVPWGTDSGSRESTQSIRRIADSLCRTKALKAVTSGHGISRKERRVHVKA
jgi:hypothetical protein